MQKFRVNGELFRVTPKGELQYFQPDYDHAYELGEMSGLWKSVKHLVGKVWKPVAVAGAAYLGYKYIGGQGGISLPSGDTISKATDVATSLLKSRATISQSKLQQMGVPPVDTGIQSDIVSDYQDKRTYQENRGGFKTSIDTQTMLLIGGGALVLVLALMRSGK